MMRVNFSGPVFQKWDPLSLSKFSGGYFLWCGFHYRLGIVLWCGYCSVSVSIFCNTVFPRVIAGDDYSREAIISNIAHWKSCPKYFVLLSH